MPPTIHLLGNPSIQDASDGGYRVRSRKSWALLAYLLLTERPPTRSELASLLFSEADDPLRALRWNLSEIRRALGAGVALGGDPVALELPPETTVDVHVLTGGSWSSAVRLPGIGSELLAGFVPKDAAAFSTWLLSEQRHLAAAAEAILHEAALGSLSCGRIEEAISFAVRVVAMNPLDENHQALLIRLYRLAGDDAAARRQHDQCVELFATELGAEPGTAVAAAVRETRRGSAPTSDPASVEAVLEAGTAAIAAGAVQAGIDSLRTAVRFADQGPAPALQVSARLVLAEALIHALGGLDQEGLAALHEANKLAADRGDRENMARATAELGYVDFLRARYDRAQHWLGQALDLADGAPWLLAKATTYLGCVESDRANYLQAVTLLERGIGLAEEAKDPRREAYARSMIGRIHLLRGELDQAADSLDASVRLAEADHWLAFLPWPQALCGEVQLAAGDVVGAAASLRQAFARACQLDDPCWEGIAARGAALVAEAEGEVDEAFVGLVDARARCNRLADPYVWLDAYILDALCTLGLRHDHPEVRGWIETMGDLTSRTGMEELKVRSLRHRGALGDAGAAAAADLLAGSIQNPIL